MRTHVATITERGQVTIPAAVRRLLHLEARDRVVFEVDDEGSVRLAPAGFTLESALCSVTPVNQPEQFETLRAAAKAAKAERTPVKPRSHEVPRHERNPALPNTG